jgi:ABC-type transport system involved in multi-copper enzyme maturation permease subunit
VKARNSGQFVMLTFAKIRAANFGLPLLGKDLTELAERRRTYYLRVVFAIGLILLAVALFVRLYRWTVFWGLGYGSILLDNVYEIEWFGLCLFVPSTVCGALAEEKERKTLELLYLTRLGPWTILFEKLLSRFLPAATFLLISLPVLAVAYALGGVKQSDVEFAAAGLFVSAFQVACITLFCSAFCTTTSAALLSAYVVILSVFFFPPAIYFACEFVTGSYPTLTPDWEFWLNSTQGITLWIYHPLAALHAYHRSWAPLAVIATSGLVFLLLARLVMARLVAATPKHRLRRFFQWLDRGFKRVNDRLARGVEFGHSLDDLPADKPIAWRESRRGNLGRVNYLLRALLLLELPIMAPTVVYVLTTHDHTFSQLGIPPLFLWTIAILIVLVRSSGLFAGEKSQQTLDLLLASPLSLKALVGQKMRCLWRVTALVSVPILLHAFLRGYLLASYGSGLHWSYFGRQGFNVSQSAWLYVIMTVVNLVVVLGLVAQLGFFIGLWAKTQGRAVIWSLGVFCAWCWIPLVISEYADVTQWALYFSPISGVLANERQDTGWWLREAERGHWGFYLLIHCGIYATIVATLAWLNFRIARRVLLRSAAPSVPLSRTRANFPIRWRSGRQPA